MTATDTPTFIAAGGETAEETRRSLGAVLGLRGGIIGPDDLAVTQNGTPNMSVDVAGGQVVIPGTEATYQGFYICENRGNTDVTIGTADSTNPRRDLVIARVRDSGYSGIADGFDITVVTGSAAASPVDPAVPDNCWVLARVSVAAGATSITNANITDLRTGATGYTSQNGRASALGGVVTCTSSTRPTSPHEGMVAYETNTNAVVYYDGSTWQYLGRSTWTSSTPTLTQGVTITKTVNYSKWIRLDNGLIVFQAKMTCGSAGTSGSDVVVGLPVTAALDSIDVGTFRIYDVAGSVGYHFGAAETFSSGASLRGAAESGLFYLGEINSGFTQLGVGDVIRVNVMYEPVS